MSRHDNIYCILQLAFVYPTEEQEKLRAQFEQLQLGHVGSSCFDRVVKPDGEWKYLDPSMHARWQGFQLAHVPQ